MHITASIVASLNSKNVPYVCLQDDVSSVTNVEFISLVAARQHQLGAVLKKDDEVFVQSRRGIQFWVDLLAVMGMGAIAIPFDPEQDEAYLSYIYSLSAASHSLGGPIKDSQVIADLGNVVTASTRQPKSVFSSHQVAAILFTSGSTGKPKGVVLTHEALLGNSQATLSCIQPSDNERLFINVPFHFTSAICHFLAMMLSGNTLVGFEKKLFYADLLRAMSTQSITAYGGAPIQLRWIAETFPYLPDPTVLPLRWAMSSGDRLDKETTALFRSALPDTDLHIFYGLTELGGRFCSLAPDLADVYPTSVGVPIDGLSVTVRDPDTLKELPANTDGEIFATGKWLFNNYYKNPEVTSQSVSEHGFSTGDVGHVDDSGQLFIMGRRDDIFKVAGQKVSGAMIEAALIKLQLFLDVSVTPIVQDSKIGTVPGVVYVLKEGVAFNKGEVLKQLRTILPPNHVPDIFIAVSAIPRTGSGKVRRADLKELVKSQL